MRTTLAILLAIFFVLTVGFAYAWITERGRPERTFLNQPRIDVTAVIDGASCNPDATDELHLAMLAYSPVQALFVWQISVEDDRIVWELEEQFGERGGLFYASPTRGSVFVANPVFDVPPNTPVTVEGFVYLGDETVGNPTETTRIAYDCTTGEVVAPTR